MKDSFRRWMYLYFLLILFSPIAIVNIGGDANADIGDTQEIRDTWDYELIWLSPDKPEWEELVDIDKVVKEVKRKYSGRINMASERHNINPDIITAVMVVESKGDPNICSKSGACGLMQLMMGTAKDMGIQDRFHEYENIWAGAKYLQKMFQRFGSWEKAYAAYNMGPNALSKLMKAGFEPGLNHFYVRRVLTTLLYM